MFFKKKNKQIRQLTVGLRTQLCKECRDFERRLCLADGKPAVFHRFVEGDRALLKFDTFCCPEDVESCLRRFLVDGVVPAGCSTELVRSTLALVEYPDGTLRKVDPERVRFLDREG